MTEELKEFWPGWTIEEELGEGSFGRVYKIRREIQGVPEYAALKVISIPKSESEIRELRTMGYDQASITEEFSDRLGKIENEYAMLARMKGCTNVVSCEDIHRIQQDNGIGWDVYIKMELLTPLIAAARKGFTEKQTIRLGMDICNALVYCERLGVVHRDVKPENIFVTGDGTQYKLGDFGIARTMEHTTMGTKIGTYEYMAPEVYNNKSYNATADIYSLGLVLYWMLNNGALPFFPQNTRRVTIDQRSHARLRRFQGEAIPAPANGSEELKRIVLKACAFDPADRYASAEQMREELEDAAWQLRAAERGQLLRQENGQQTIPTKPETTVKAGTAADPAIEGKRREEPPKTVYAAPKHTPQRKKGGIFLSVLVLVLLLVMCFGAGMAMSGFFGKECQHEWQDATCTAPRTCTLCGKTSGKTLAHVWEQATCTVAKTCTVCGTSEGAAAGHQWKDATCINPRRCTVCGKTSGSALGHTWKDATYTDPKTCTVCGKTTGEPLQKDGWVTEYGMKYYNENGKHVTGWKTIGGNRYYFQHDGAMATGTTLTIGSDKYTFDTSGINTKICYSTVDDHWADDVYRYGNGGRSVYKQLDTAVDDVVSLQFTVGDVTGNAGTDFNCSWTVLVRADGKWVDCGRYTVQNNMGTKTITFDSPVKVDAYVSYPNRSGNATYSCWFIITDVTVDLT